MLDPRALRVFEAACRAGSITGASKMLNISQPAVSNTIAQLEDRLGAKVFDRGRGGVTLTDAGEALRRHSWALDALIESAFEDVRRVEDGRTGTIRIGGTPGALMTLVPQMSGPLEEHFGPHVLHILERADDVLMGMLRSQRIDFACVTTEISAPPDDIVEVTVASDEFVMVVGPDLAHLPDRMSLAETRHLHWILPEAVGAFRRQLDAMFVSAQVPTPDSVIRCDSLLTTKALVLHSGKATILPSTVVESDVRSKSLRAITIEEADFRRKVGVRYLRTAYHNPKIERVLKALAVKHEP